MMMMNDDSAAAAVGAGDDVVIAGNCCQIQFCHGYLSPGKCTSLFFFSFIFFSPHTFNFVRLIYYIESYEIYKLSPAKITTSSYLLFKYFAHHYNAHQHIRK